MKKKNYIPLFEEFDSYEFDPQYMIQKIISDVEKDSRIIKKSNELQELFNEIIKSKITDKEKFNEGVKDYLESRGEYEFFKITDGLLSNLIQQEMGIESESISKKPEKEQIEIAADDPYKSAINSYQKAFG